MPRKPLVVTLCWLMLAGHALAPTVAGAETFPDDDAVRVLEGGFGGASLGRAVAPFQRCGPLPLVQLRPGAGFRLRTTRRAWGTPATVTLVHRVLGEQARAFPRQRPLSVHDLSRCGGGALPEHASHRTGRDVDIALPLRGVSAYLDATRATLHHRRTLALILGLVATCQVEFILLDRELQRSVIRHGLRNGLSPAELALVFQGEVRAAVGMVRHFPHHKNHIHFRVLPAVGPPPPARFPVDWIGRAALCTPRGPQKATLAQDLLRRYRSSLSASRRRMVAASSTRSAWVRTDSTQARRVKRSSRRVLER